MALKHVIRSGLGAAVRRTLDPSVLRRVLFDTAEQAPSVSVPAGLLAAWPIYLSREQLSRMAALIGAIERLVALPAWQERALLHAPDSARWIPKNAGVFLGYDFHIGADGPQLIEINTNAGGGLLNARLRDAWQIAQPARRRAETPSPGAVERVFVAMFREEWRLARGEAPLGRLAIVDAAPARQYLAPEFELFRRLFEANGIATMIAAPEELSFDGKVLRCRGETLDLIYNRLTDFALTDAANLVLRQAWLADAVVLTPHPRAHALYADKRNLVALSDDAWLAAIGVAAADRERLRSGVPPGAVLTAGNAEAFWAARRNCFFKPAAGYGGRNVQRGSTLSRRAFEEIVRSGYVAQARVPPSERRVRLDGGEQRFKVEVRNYVYQGQVQLVAACLYQGPASNLHTPGGGFATVLAGQAQE